MRQQFSSPATTNMGETMKRTILILTALLAIAGCGSAASTTNAPATTTTATQVAKPQGPTDEQQIRSLETQDVQDIMSGNANAMCPLTTDPGACATDIAAAQQMGISLKSVVPADWQAQIANAQVNVQGNSATMTGFDNTSPNKFLKRNGQWFIVQAPAGS